MDIYHVIAFGVGSLAGFLGTGFLGRMLITLIVDGLIEDRITAEVKADRLQTEVHGLQIEVNRLESELNASRSTEQATANV